MDLRLFEKVYLRVCMADKKTNFLLAFMFRNSKLRNAAISDENLAKENARNANKLAKSKIKSEAVSGMNLLKMLANEGNEIAEVLIEDKSDKASAAGYKSHKEDHEMKEQAIKYWMKNIDPSVSNDKAAEMLTKVVPLKHSTLLRHIAEARKLYGIKKS